MNENTVNDIPQHAVSIYGENEPMEDFPVLKAFQQYIDAEQEKARKRMIGLGIFFGAILILVVIVFMFLLHGINVRNQNLSDRLVEYAMKQSERPMATSPAPVADNSNAEALKAMTATLTALQNSIKKSNETVVNRPQETDRFTQERAILAAERKKIEEERERLRQIEIDRQRRKLYPEFYETEAQHSPKTPKAASPKTLTDDDIREIIREAYPETISEKNVNINASEKEKDSAETKEAEGADEAIEYFKDDDYSVPVGVKGSPSKVKFTFSTKE